MAYDFPNAPTVGQAANGYVWDGEKWVSSSSGDTAFVKKTGDTMSGNLTMQTRIVLTKSASAQSSNIDAELNGKLRWTMQYGNETVESGSNAGSDFALSRWSDAGAYLGSPLFITRSNGNVILENDLTWGGAAWTTYTPTLTFASGANGSASGRYKRLGKTCAVSFIVSISAAGTLSAIGLPLVVSSGFGGCLIGREGAVNGLTWVGFITPTAGGVIPYNYLNSGAVGVGYTLYMSGTYETA